MISAALDTDEKDILAWANRKVAGAGSPLQISSLRDPSLRSGVFLLTLLRAVAPECVDAAEVLGGTTAEECKLNAKYAISCAHKMGCRVFATWEDIVEARAARKLPLCLLVALCLLVVVVLVLVLVLVVVVVVVLVLTPPSIFGRRGPR